MTATSSGPNTSTPTPQTKRRGCGGCIRKGTGCAAIITIPLLIVLVWPEKSSPPSRAFAYLPATTIAVLRTERLEMITGAALDPIFSNELRTWALALLRSSNQQPLAFSQLRCEGKDAVIMEVEKAEEILRLPQIDASRFELMGNVRIYPATRDVSRSFLMLGNSIVVAGDSAAVREIAAVASGDTESLYDARPDIRPMLTIFSQMTAVDFKFQPEDVGKRAGCLGAIVGKGNPLFSLAGVRGMAFGVSVTDDVCKVSLGFQYGNRVASSIVASGFGIFGLLNTVPVGIPEELGSPESIDVEQESGLAMATAYFDPAKCAPDKD